MKLDRYIIATILSLFIVGLGQIYNNETKKGLSLFIITFIIQATFLQLDANSLYWLS